LSAHSPAALSALPYDDSSTDVDDTSSIQQQKCKSKGSANDVAEQNGRKEKDENGIAKKDLVSNWKHSISLLSFHQVITINVSGMRFQVYFPLLSIPSLSFINIIRLMRALSVAFPIQDLVIP
jgi:hypothetical protein